MLCIGYGRYPPQCVSDVWLTIVSMLTGATFYALFVGQSTSLIQTFDTSKRMYAEKVRHRIAIFSRSYCTLNSTIGRYRVESCIVALKVGVGLKVESVFRMELPVHFFRHFCCRMYRLATNFQKADFSSKLEISKCSC